MRKFNIMAVAATAALLLSERAASASAFHPQWPGPGFTMASRIKHKVPTSHSLAKSENKDLLTDRAVIHQEPLLSPKAKALADSLRKVPSVASDLNLATNRPIGNAKAWELAQSFRKVPSTGPSIDLAHGPRPLLSPKDPRYEQAVPELRQQQFQVAPLK